MTEVIGIIQDVKSEIENKNYRESFEKMKVCKEKFDEIRQS